MEVRININLITALLVSVILLGSCFKEIDTDKMDPLETITAVNDIYTSQTFYKIEENEIKTRNNLEFVYNLFHED